MSLDANTRWWLCRPGETPIGPFTWEALTKTVRDSGGVGDWMACSEADENWKALASDPELSAALQPARPRATTHAGSSPCPPPTEFSDAGFPKTPNASPGPSQSGVGAPSVSSADTSLCTLLHLSMLADLLIPFVGGALPLTLWLVNRTKPSVDAHGKEIMNWWIFTFILEIACGVLLFCGTGLLLLPVVLLVEYGFPIYAAIKASKGEFYRYPMPFRLIK